MTAIGDTFRLKNLNTLIDTHLHIIISDPSLNNTKIVTVNFTTWRTDKDQSCIVEVGDHGFIRVRSCVDYRREKLLSVDVYERCIASGDILPHDPVNRNLLERILNGAAISPFLSFGSRKILVDQGLIDSE